MRRVRAWVLALALLLVAACGHASVSPVDHSGMPTPPHALPANSIPGSETHMSTLDVDGVTSGALDPASLEGLLGRAGYVVGTERAFVSRSTPLDRVATRVLEFRSADGARVYLGWVDAHPADLIGDAHGGDPLDMTGLPKVFVHTPTGCCPKDTTKILAAWQRDRDVLLLVAQGAMATRKSILALASKLDGVV